MNQALPDGRASDTDAQSLFLPLVYPESLAAEYEASAQVDSRRSSEFFWPSIR